MNTAKPRAGVFGVAITLAIAGVAYGLGARSGRPDGGELLPSDEPARKELAPYMGELQRLTHKLALSIAAENRALATFYADEVLEQLVSIQTDLPEYESLPIALLVDRMTIPLGTELASALRAHQPWPQTRVTLNRVIQSCNDCHAATQHAFIRITPGFGVNPFNQDFQP